MTLKNKLIIGIAISYIITVILFKIGTSPDFVSIKTRDKFFYLAVGFFITGGILIFFLIQVIYKEKSAISAKLLVEYRESIFSGNKIDALNKGRIYYSYIRGGNLSVYDEQAISNDLSTMKNLK